MNNSYDESVIFNITPNKKYKDKIKKLIGFSNKIKANIGIASIGTKPF